MAEQETGKDYFCEKLYEYGLKLELKMHPTIFFSTFLYHRVCKFMDEDDDVDDTKYVLVMASLRVSTQINEEQVTVDDIIRVFYPLILHRDATLLDVGEQYTFIKEQVDMMTSFIIRTFRLELGHVMPTQYLLEYLVALTDMFPARVFKEFDIAKMCWGLISDFFLSDESVNFPSKHIAITAIYITFRFYGLSIPGYDPQSIGWATVFVPDLTFEKIATLVKLMIPVKMKGKNCDNASVIEELLQNSAMSL